MVDDTDGTRAWRELCAHKQRINVASSSYSPWIDTPSDTVDAARLLAQALDGEMYLSNHWGYGSDDHLDWLKTPNEESMT